MAPTSMNRTDKRTISPSYRGNKVIKSSKACKGNQSSPHPDYTSEELHKLHEDRYELQQILHVATRDSVKDIIQAEINLITAKISSLHDSSSELSHEEATWAEVVARKTKPPITTLRLSPCRRTITSNRFNLLSCTEMDVNNTEAKLELKSSNLIPHSTKKEVKKISRFTNNRRKVLILGDSHARDCAQELQHNLNRNFSVQGIVKPGASMKDIVSSPPNSVKNLSSKDTVVIWGGARDIGKNESNQALKEITNFVQTHSKNNVIVISAPHRYDLSHTSCVNQEVKVFNRKLYKHLRAFNNTLIVEVDSNRDYYTRHGLHLNRKGKEQIAKKIALAIQDKLNPQKDTQSIMRYNPSTNEIIIPNQDNTTTTQHEDNLQKQIKSPPIQHNSPTVRVSLRHKKPPRSLTDDFLW